MCNIIFRNITEAFFAFSYFPLICTILRRLTATVYIMWRQMSLLQLINSPQSPYIPPRTVFNLLGLPISCDKPPTTTTKSNTDISHPHARSIISRDASSRAKTIAAMQLCHADADPGLTGSDT
ncbi:hypothetical protein ILYODFUR_006824 [Ilyodon furcidens]|uniref:Uncharacterized protein n=1 Tax=Ilyodon furcidens TaxID=33524 RepID=A0ABV0URI6_9TELE